MPRGARDEDPARILVTVALRADVFMAFLVTGLDGDGVRESP
jgi:hypothetical protein